MLFNVCIIIHIFVSEKQGTSSVLDWADVEECAVFTAVCNCNKERVYKS